MVAFVGYGSIKISEPVNHKNPEEPLLVFIVYVRNETPISNHCYLYLLTYFDFYYFFFAGCSLYWFFLWTSPIVLGHTHKHRGQQPTEVDIYLNFEKIIPMNAFLFNKSSNFLFTCEQFLVCTVQVIVILQKNGFYSQD